MREDRNDEAQPARLFCKSSDAGKPWALLMRRTFGLDVLECPKCKGRMTLLAVVIDDRSIARYLKKIGEPTNVPARAPPRGPPYSQSTVLRRKTLADIDTTTSAVFDS